MSNKIIGYIIQCNTNNSIYYKEQTIQDNKAILMLSNNKQGINNNIHDKRIVLLKKIERR